MVRSLEESKARQRPHHNVAAKRRRRKISSRQQQERPRVVRPRREKGGGGSGTGWLGGTVWTGRGSAGVWPALGRGAVASARVARSRPKLLAKMVQGHRGHAYAPGALDE